MPFLPIKNGDIQKKKIFRFFPSKMVIFEEKIKQGFQSVRYLPRLVVWDAFLGAALFFVDENMVPLS